MKNPFKRKLRQVQEAYDLGWEHGFEAGWIEQKNEIIDLLSSHIENIDWLNETPLEVREILPIVRNHKQIKDEITWGNE
jgi:hypothetical protein